MTDWRSEFRLNARYAASGALNTVLGFTAIAVFTKMGLAPVLANIFGYGIALSVGFTNAKHFVFRSGGHITREATRYLTAFAVCYAINLAVLYLCLSRSVLPLIAQGVAVCSYVVSMYTASRLFVFPRTSDDTSA